MISPHSFHHHEHIKIESILKTHQSIFSAHDNKEQSRMLCGTTCFNRGTIKNKHEKNYSIN